MIRILVDWIMGLWVVDQALALVERLTSATLVQLDPDLADGLQPSADQSAG